MKSSCLIPSLNSSYCAHQFDIHRTSRSHLFSNDQQTQPRINPRWRCLSHAQGTGACDEYPSAHKGGTGSGHLTGFWPRHQGALSGVLGYGSLIWNPAFDHTARANARHLGLPPVLLHPDRRWAGAVPTITVWYWRWMRAARAMALAFRLPARRMREELSVVWAREMAIAGQLSCCLGPCGDRQGADQRRDLCRQSRQSTLRRTIART